MTWGGNMTIRPAGHRTAGTQPGYEDLIQQWRASSPGSPCTVGLFGDAVDTEKGVFRSGKDHMSNLRENSPRQPTHIVE